MNLDSRRVYFKTQEDLLSIPLSKLKQLAGELFRRRFEDHDIEIDAYYRLAASVLIQRTSKGSTLIYHMKKFICVT